MLEYISQIHRHPLGLSYRTMKVYDSNDGHYPKENNYLGFLSIGLY